MGRTQIRGGLAAIRRRSRGRRRHGSFNWQRYLVCRRYRDRIDGQPQRSRYLGQNIPLIATQFTAVGANRFTHQLCDVAGAHFERRGFDLLRPWRARVG